MYVTTGKSFTKILGQVVTFKRSGSLVVNPATVGIKSRKENVQLPGPHAQTITDAKPVFYFIPAKQEAEAGVNAVDAGRVAVVVRLLFCAAGCNQNERDALNQKLQAAGKPAMK